MIIKMDRGLEMKISVSKSGISLTTNKGENAFITVTELISYVEAINGDETSKKWLIETVLR